MRNTGRTSMRITHLLVSGLLATALPVQFAVADADGERAALARINHELQAIEPLIAEAASQANPDARIRFQYDWLRQDLRIDSARDPGTHRCPTFRTPKLPATARRLPPVMSGHDGSTGLGIPGGFRIYTGDAADGHRLRRAGARPSSGSSGCHWAPSVPGRTGKSFCSMWSGATLRASIVLMVLGFYLR